ncbi:37S ribosomal protein NAM9-like protein [Elsinoe fawcettii]|nr:37S ribosomal protein NAM9-like protein [Elsinoe fawcettii]
MTRKRFHNLKRPKARQDWSKWTLFNLSRLREPRHDFKTFFQQKWEAKSLTRAFHGYQIREKKWQLMFDRRLPAVVPMDANVLAKTDGRDMSAGRGGGRASADDELVEEDEEVDESADKGKVEGEPDASLGKRTPYMQMAYWPTERRLDTAVWRALFSSSTLQARQFVVHGAVKVNGKRMRHPGYLLNPGDMFQVEPERVLYATGARKFDKNSPESSQGRDNSAEDNKNARRTKEELADEEDAELEEELEVEEAQQGLEQGETIEPVAEEEVQNPKKALRTLLLEAKEILADPKEKAKLSGKKKQEMRAFSRQVKSTMSKIRGDTVAGAPAEDTVEELQAAMEKLMGGEASASTDSATETTAKDGEKETDEGKISPQRDARLLRQALDLASEDDASAASVDASKPYATPWQPREYMSAFAFIPRYLEVNHKICSAVYLRHPVARPGLAEVPSPYNEEVYELAHNWYLRRR